MSEKHGGSRDYEYSSTNDLLSKKPSRSFSMKSQKPPDLRLRSYLVKALSHFDRSNDDNVKIKYIKEIWEVVDSAWQLPVIGRDVAYEFSDTLRREKVLAYMVNRLQLENVPSNVKKECARLLSQILTTDNRHYVAKNCLDVLTKYTKSREDIDTIRNNICILESLFKDSEATCTKLIDLGALDTVLHACRHDDLWTARHCSAALANASVYGGSINHRRMVEKGAPDWLFPLAFRTDDFCRYYACLAVTVLAANPLVEKAVVKSGTLDLVEPFVQSHDPYEFAQSNPSHAQGRTANFLQRMIPLLISGRSEAQALASFYFAMEASIKAKQQKSQIFSDISAIIPLKRVIATSQSSIARVLAGRCLKIIGEQMPRKLSSQIHLWDLDDVQSWLTVAGFRAFQSSFRASTVDGEMLLLLTEKELKEDLDMTNNVHRKRFIRDLNRLRAGADYRTVDTSGICDWLKQIDTSFAQYTYRLLQAGVDSTFLPLLSDEHLKIDCGIENGVHRTRILESLGRVNNNGDGLNNSGRKVETVHDVFISYRRNNGSHLASLLKVHLQLRGFRVFLDVDNLHEGDYTKGLIRNVKSASSGFIVVLTAGALDKCAIDHEGTDWIHKEIATAIANKRNIVPVTTETFQWPLPEDLPKDMSPICFYNGVKWIHEYQDACVGKIERFLLGQDPPSSKLSRLASSTKSSRDKLNTQNDFSPKKRSATHPNQPVRPSGSSDNLADNDRYPRPRQRASPPGQASNLPGSVASRGVPGARSESARSLDQGDGAPHEQGAKQLPYKAKANPVKSPDRVQSPKKGPNPTSPPSTVSTSSSSKNLAPRGLKKDIVRLDDVMGSSERSRKSESSSSSKYGSSDESDEEWENERDKRGGADGKSIQEPKAPPVRQATVKKPIENAKVNGNNIKNEKNSGLESKPSQRQTSPEHKIKPSSKYKAPPPPMTPTTLPAEPRVPHGNRVPSGKSSQPEPAPRPVRSVPPDDKRVPGQTPPSELGQQPKKPSRPAKSSGATPIPIDGDLKQKKVLGSNLNIEIEGPAAVPVNSGESNGNRKNQEDNRESPDPTDDQPMHGTLSESEYSDLASEEGSGGQRTNADGNDAATTSSLSRTGSSSSTSSDLDDPPKEKEKPSIQDRNTNNSNNAGVNGLRNSENPRQNISPNSSETTRSSRSPDEEIQLGSRPRMSSAKSNPLSRSTQSVESSDLSVFSAPAPTRKQTQGGLSNLIARRDVAPHDPSLAPRKSASERLKITRPPHPNYPMGASHFHPPGSLPPPYAQHSPQKGYNMDHYNAAMANPTYQNSQHYPPATHQVGAKTPVTVTHGFDTAV